MQNYEKIHYIGESINNCLEKLSLLNKKLISNQPDEEEEENKETLNNPPNACDNNIMSSINGLQNKKSVIISKSEGKGNVEENNIDSRCKDSSSNINSSSIFKKSEKNHTEEINENSQVNSNKLSIVKSSTSTNKDNMIVEITFKDSISTNNIIALEQNIDYSDINSLQQNSTVINQFLNQDRPELFDKNKISYKKAEQSKPLFEELNKIPILEEKKENTNKLNSSIQENITINSNRSRMEENVLNSHNINMANKNNINELKKNQSEDIYIIHNKNIKESNNQLNLKTEKNTSDKNPINNKSEMNNDFMNAENSIFNNIFNSCSNNIRPLDFSNSNKIIDFNFCFNNKQFNNCLDAVGLAENSDINLLENIATNKYNCKYNYNTIGHPSLLANSKTTNNINHQQVVDLIAVKEETERIIEDNQQIFKEAMRKKIRNSLGIQCEYPSGTDQNGFNTIDFKSKLRDRKIFSKNFFFDNKNNLKKIEDIELLTRKTNRNCSFLNSSKTANQKSSVISSDKKNQCKLDTQNDINRKKINYSNSGHKKIIMKSHYNFVSESNTTHGFAMSKYKNKK